MSNDVALGQLLTGDEHRDAIHIAISPVVASERLYAGQDIGFVGGSQEVVSPTADTLIGIVDPFLGQAVHPGQRCYMFLYPQTITSLRHDWTHPAFEASEDVAADPLKEESEEWLRNFIAGADCPRYETLIRAAVGESISEVDPIYGETYRNDGEYLTFFGRDAHGEIPPEFWDHVENVTGKKCNVRPQHFSCSC